MSTSQIQEKLRSVIKDGDPGLLKMLFAVAKEYNDDNYTLPGKPMAPGDLKERIKNAKKRIRSGHFTSQENLEKEMKKW